MPCGRVGGGGYRNAFKIPTSRYVLRILEIIGRKDFAGCWKHILMYILLPDTPWDKSYKQKGHRPENLMRSQLTPSSQPRFRCEDSITLRIPAKPFWKVSLSNHHVPYENLARAPFQGKKTVTQKIWVKTPGVHKPLTPKIPIDSKAAINPWLRTLGLRALKHTHCISYFFWAHRITRNLKCVITQQRNCATKFSKKLTFTGIKQKKPTSKYIVYHLEEEQRIKWKGGVKTYWSSFLLFVQRHTHMRTHTSWDSLNETQRKLSFQMSSFCLPYALQLLHI